MISVSKIAAYECCFWGVILLGTITIQPFTAWSLAALGGLVLNTNALLANVKRAQKGE